MRNYLQLKGAVGRKKSRTQTSSEKSLFTQQARCSRPDAGSTIPWHKWLWDTNCYWPVQGWEVTPYGSFSLPVAYWRALLVKEGAKHSSDHVQFTRPRKRTPSNYMTTKRVRTIAKLRELSLVPGLRAQVPSKWDQQFMFDARTGAPGEYTASNLLWTSMEEKVPEEMLYNVYVDFEITHG